MQYQALVKLDCYITAECQTEPKEDGQPIYDQLKSPKAPRLTTVPTPGQFSVREKKIERVNCVGKTDVGQYYSGKEVG